MELQVFILQDTGEPQVQVQMFQSQEQQAKPEELIQEFVVQEEVVEGHPTQQTPKVLLEVMEVYPEVAGEVVVVEHLPQQDLVQEEMVQEVKLEFIHGKKKIV